MADRAAHRYERHHQVSDIGFIGQDKISKAKILIIGCGGLGSHLAISLCAMGIKCLGLVDHDVVSLTNIHRQQHFKMTDIGCSKVEVISNLISEINNDSTVVAHNKKLNDQLADELFEQYDIVCDATDNFDARYLINDKALLHQKPVIYGAVLKMEGFISVFNAALGEGKRSANLRDLFPQLPKGSTVPDCNSDGVLGSVPPLISQLMATEAIKLIVGIGQPLIGTYLCIDLANHTYLKLKYKID